MTESVLTEPMLCEATVAVGRGEVAASCAAVRRRDVATLVNVPALQGVACEARETSTHAHATLAVDHFRGEYDSAPSSVAGSGAEVAHEWCLSSTAFSPSDDDEQKCDCDDRAESHDSFDFCS